MYLDNLMNKRDPHNESRPDPVNKSLEARGQLYRLITSLRKDANQFKDPKSQTMFKMAAEVAAGLARAFRDFEKEIAPDDGDEPCDDEDNTIDQR
ncbi:MAG: hypothetical protein K8L99_28625 [Anaerolineae bacterium]|nr:hypothetical protein [Anaerolineae bacterium]